MLEPSVRPQGTGLLQEALPERPRMARRGVADRVRASIACSNCRKRRVRCIIRERDSKCDHCAREGVECVVRDTDLRRRPYDQKHVKSLTDRIAMLESLIAAGSNGSQSPPSDGLEGGSNHDRDRMDHVQSSPAVNVNDDRLAFNAHKSRNEEPSGVLKHSDAKLSDAEFLARLPAHPHHTLLENFWRYYHSEMQSIHRPAFQLGQRTKNPTTYSPFLHLCVLAIGLRYVDHRSPDFAPYLAGHGNESVFHARARMTIRWLIETEPHVSLIQGLLLFGDLEFGLGRYNSGWMQATLACQLCVSTQLHTGAAETTPTDDLQNCAMTVWACALYDRYWALYLNRKPTFIAMSEVKLPKPTDFDSQVEGSQSPNGQRNDIIYSTLVELMDLLAGFNAEKELHAKTQDENTYIMVAISYQQLLKWYSKLPENLKWDPKNIEGAPSSFFSLHQQFHYGVILLHRAFAFSDQVDSSGQEPWVVRKEMEKMFDMPRRLILHSAIMITEILSCHQQHHHTRTIFATSVQHADAAIKSIVKCFERERPPDNAAKLTQAYAVLMEFLEANAATYDAAAKILTELGQASRDIDIADTGSRSAPQSPTQQDSHGSAAGSSAYSESLTNIPAQSKEVFAGRAAEPEPNFPNLGNVMYAHELISLGVDI